MISTYRLRFPKLALMLMLAAALAPTARAAPANDQYANATPITSLPYAATVSTVGATLEFAEPQPCGLIGATVWWTIDPPVPGSSVTAVADTFGSSFDTVLAVYAILPTGLFVPIVQACNDDSGVNLQSRVEWTTAPGIRYAIQAGGFNGATGTLQLHVFRGTV